MKISKFFQQSILLFSSFGLLMSAQFINNKFPVPRTFISKQDSSTNFKNNLYLYFNFGQKRLISSLLWISTILESDNDHYHEKNLNSWMYLRFKTISVLEPMFFENYAFSGPYLSVIKDDLEGASEMFKLGLQHYPNNLGILQNAAFHFYFEVHDYKRASDIHKRLLHSPKVSPIIISNLARMEHDSGNIEDAFTILENHYIALSDKESLVGKKIHENLYALRAEMDLKCLNEVKKNCKMYDYDHESYIFLDGKYSAKKVWAKFKIKTMH